MFKFKHGFLLPTKALHALPEKMVVVYTGIAAVALLGGNSRWDMLDRVLVGMACFGLIVGVTLAFYGGIAFVELFIRYGHWKGAYATRTLRRLMFRTLCTAWLGVNLLAMLALFVRHMK